MRVLHVASGREWRGGQRQTWLLARELAKLDVAQTVVTRRGSELARRLRLAGIHVQPCGWTMGLDPRALIAILHEARRTPAVLHAHDPHAFTLAAVAGRRARCPVVVTRRATFPLRRPRPWREADRVVAISDAVRRQLIADGVAPERIAVVTSGIDLTAAGTATRGDFRARLGLAPGAALVVTVAALTREKGLDTLIAAASRLRMRTPPVHWAIAGTGPLARELGSLASAGEVGRTVHLLGHLNDPAGLLAEADCVVMASTSEGFGSSLLDAMALGRPVIATSVGGMPEVVGSAGIIVPPQDAAALADAVAALLADPARAASLGMAARERVREFGADRMAHAMVAVYRSVAQTD